MWQFIAIIYFGLNFAFALFVLTYDYDECVVGRDVNPIGMFVLNIFGGLFIYVYSMFDNITCNLDVNRRGRMKDNVSIVKVFNDFTNFSFD